MEKYDAIILGAGASGLMAAIRASERGRRVLVVDHSEKAGRKLLASGGGKCNVTNRHVSVSDYLGEDSSFCRHALGQFTVDSIAGILRGAGIETEEREHGRIFCKNGAGEIVAYLTGAAKSGGADFSLGADVSEVSHTACFQVKCGRVRYESQRLLVATGGLAWPQTGATDLGYRIARQFGHRVTPLRPALAGFVLPQDSPLLHLQGISLNAQLRIRGKSAAVEEPLLFTHRGISGPSVLQISCFYEKDDVVEINFLPPEDAVALMHDPRNGKLLVKNLFAHLLPERLVRAIIPAGLSERKVAGLARKERGIIAGCIHSFPVCPASPESFSRAEATMGGVRTSEINPKSMESLLTEGLFFSGEVVDITGRLGGYNIHWAFASGHLAGEYL
ncbi:MAG: NAD(P)/FAD-dependent oxidoreductase [Tannerella sp.]|jgi:predicted Rossmann fold flavoprotein|nr:NAD(P)/FAD-dependent oxidoreductase [Tannerella sp.]